MGITRTLTDFPRFKNSLKNSRERKRESDIGGCRKKRIMLMLQVLGVSFIFPFNVVGGMNLDTF